MNKLPYEVFIDSQHHRSAYSWCEEQWGKPWSVVSNRNGIWSCFWAGLRGPQTGKYRYIFEHEKDAIIFLLRWL